MAAIQPRQAGLTGHHVLAMILAFFGIVFAVNGVFLYSALSTHTGVVAVEPYRKGLHYNDRIEASQRQDLLNWKASVNADMSGAVRLAMIDEAGRGVAGLAVRGVVARPSTSDLDQTFRFTEIAPGKYEATVTALLPGAWIVTYEAYAAASSVPVHRGRVRLWLK